MRTTCALREAGRTSRSHDGRREAGRYATSMSVHWNPPTAKESGRSIEEEGLIARSRCLVNAAGNIGITTSTSMTRGSNENNKSNGTRGRGAEYTGKE